MKKQSLPIKVKQLKKMYERGTLTFNNPIQRRSGQWDHYRKSLLINSIIDDVIIPPIFLIKEDRGSVDSRGRKICDYDVIDGKQRLTETFEFMDGGFKLHDLTPPVEVDGEKVEIAGKYFSELDDEIQENIENFIFQIYNLEDNSDEEIEEFFLRINGGTALSKNQNTKGRVGIKMMRYLNDFLSGNFFSTVCNFSGAQYRSEVDFCTMLQCLMMLDVSAGNYDFVSMSENDTRDYGASIHDGLDKEVQDQFEKIMAYLEEAFAEDKKQAWLRKTHIPAVFLTAKHAMEKNIPAKGFREWFEEFAYKYYNPECDYAKNYCGAGSVKKAKVCGRIEYMQLHFDKFFAGNESTNDENEEEEVESGEE